MFRTSPLLKHLLSISSVALLAFTVGCTKSGGGDDEESSNAKEAENLIPSGLFSQCGVVIDDQLTNPVALDNAVRVNIEPVSTEVSIVSLLEDKDGIGDAGSKILVKHQAVTDSGISANRSAQGLEIISANRNGAFFIPAGDACKVTVDGGGTAIVGQLFGASVNQQGINLNLNEELLKEKSVAPDASDPCGGSILAQCYGGVKDTAPQTSSGVQIFDFLWKPESERDGSLVILVDACDVIANVEGAISETKGPGYPSNGRCSTIRFSKPGGAYGTNVRVYFTDSNGDIVPVFGEDEIIIPNGSERVERQG